MDSQRTVDHLRDEAAIRKDTTLGDLMDTAAEELDDAEECIKELQEVLAEARDQVESLAKERDEGWASALRMQTQRDDLREQLNSAQTSITGLESSITDLEASIERLTATCADFVLKLRRRNASDHAKRMQRPATFGDVSVDEWTDETKPPASD